MKTSPATGICLRNRHVPEMYPHTTSWSVWGYGLGSLCSGESPSHPSVPPCGVAVNWSVESGESTTTMVIQVNEAFGFNLHP